MKNVFLCLILSGHALFSSTISIAQTHELWGTTYAGGKIDFGTVFKTDEAANNPQHVFSFDNGELGQWSDHGELIVASNGKIYGTSGQDSSMANHIFEYDPIAQVYVNKYTFGGLNGAMPVGQLLEMPGNKLFGITTKGGLYNFGVLFEYDFVTNVYSKKYDFGVPSGIYNVKDGLMLASNGKLYGTSEEGGTFNEGTLFEYDYLSETMTIKVSFNPSTMGYNPSACPVEADNGKLYGATRAGGLFSGGTLYEYDLTTELHTTVFDFSNIDGTEPCHLLKASNGKLYGKCAYGGAFDLGAFYEYDVFTDSHTVLHHFEIGMSSYLFQEQIVQASDGKLYGFNDLTLFAYDITAGDFVLKLSDVDDDTTGFYPGTLVEAADNKLYAMSEGGPSLYSLGMILCYDPILNKTYAVFEFNNKDINGGQDEGWQTASEIFQFSNEQAFGTTPNGGDNDFGVLFRIDPFTGSYHKKVDFSGTADGANPSGKLAGSDDRIYGTTSLGGTNNLGVIFEFNPTDFSINKLVDFDGALKGSNPEGGLIMGSDQLLYGLTTTGGANDKGVLYSYDPVSTSYIKIHDFDGLVTGEFPKGALFEASNGKFYGMTSSGGANGLGVIFEYDPILNTVTNVFDFDGSNAGANPYGSLIEGSTGKFYGMTRLGGANNLGVVFEYDYITDSFSKLIDFDGALNGAEPYGSLSQTNSGSSLFGLTRMGGVNDAGVLFEYDPNTSTYTKKHDFDFTSKGKNPAGSLSQVFVCPGYAITDSITIYPGMNFLFPDGTLVTNINSATTHVSELLTTGGCDSTITTVIQMGIPLMGNVFTLPVSVLDSCNATATAMIEGGVPPYHYDWFTQAHNEDLSVIDSLCHGAHTLKVTDDIGDELFVDYYITDSADYYVWYDTTVIIPTDTIFMIANNCLIDYSLPLDSAFITQFYYMYPDSIPPGQLHFIEYTYYQAGTSYVHQDTISMDVGGSYLLDFSVYCPSKSVNSIKVVLTAFSFPEILSVGDSDEKQFMLLYPNPSSDKLFVAVPQHLSEVSIELVDMSGRTVYKLANQTGLLFELNVSELSVGTYLVRVQSEHFVATSLFQKN